MSNSAAKSSHASIEARSRYRARVGKTQQVILETALAASVISVAMLAPNALQMFGPLTRNRKWQKMQTIRRAQKQLHRDGYLAYEKKPQGAVARVTEAGRRELLLRGSRALAGQAPKRWDGKWRMIVFDIGEYRKRTRDLLRRALVNIGFVQLQKSVWVYPYPCEELVVLLKAEFKIGKDVLYVIADEIEGEAPLLKAFHLRRRR